MSMTEASQKFADNLVRVLSEYVMDAVEALEDKPSRIIHVAPGAQVAWDDCCDGQLWSRIVKIEPLRNQNPAGRGVGGGGCHVTHFFATVELGLLRCAATVDDQGVAPAAVLIENEGVAGVGDMTALLQVILCKPETYTIGSYTPSGPQGGCVGGSWTFTIRLDNCLRCPEE